MIASYVGIPLFGAVAAPALDRLLRPRPALVIHATGITDAASLPGAGHLTWPEIAYVSPYEYSGQWFLGVVPVDADARMARRSLLRRAFMSLNTRGWPRSSRS